MPERHLTKLKLVAGVTLALLVSGAWVGDRAHAQDGTMRRLPTRNRTLNPGSPPDYHGLTITRPPDAGPDAYSPDDVYADGPIRYNDIHDFSPFPYADSGRQLPFGLDGIGGYGSDLGFNEGQDAAIYDRGAFNRAAK